MNKLIKKYLTIALAAVFVFGFSIYGIVAPDKKVSLSERRPHASFPTLNSESVFSGKFMSDFETYSLEQFPLRDSFRGIKSYTALNLLGMKDNNGIFLKDGYIFKTEYPYNAESVERAVRIFRNIHDTFLTDENNVYISVIPDKNCYLPEDSGQLVINYDELFSVVKDNTDFAQYINIYPLLELEDYYLTDSHWRQENITDVAQYLLNSMGAGSAFDNYKKIDVESPFYGVYYGQSALKTKADNISYLTSPVIDSSKVYDFETGKYISVYDLEKLNGTDPYEMFLSGSKSILSIENKQAQTNKELVIFRDSFGSSIAPLLINNYSKITLVDIRYIPSSAVTQYISFDNQDVLFLYSTLVLNNSITLK